MISKDIDYLCKDLIYRDREDALLFLLYTNVQTAVFAIDTAAKYTVLISDRKPDSGKVLRTEDGHAWRSYGGRQVHRPGILTEKYRNPAERSSTLPRSECSA